MTKEEKKLNFKEIDDKCEECRKNDESVRENLILSDQNDQIIKTIK